MATVVMCRVRNLACTAGSASDAMHKRHMNEVHLHWISYFIQTHEDEETEYDVHLLKKMGNITSSIGLVLDDVGVVS